MPSPAETHTPSTLTVDRIAYTGHGVCASLLPQHVALDEWGFGLTIELTVDHPDVEQITAERRRTAAADLDRWLGGDHSSNNTYRPD